VFLLAAAYPAGALLFQCLRDAGGVGLSWPSERTLILLGRTSALAAVATLVCHIVALPISGLLARSRGGNRAAWLLAALTGVLFCPPMVCAFGWRRLLPMGMPPSACCILVWTLWLWPVVALLLGAAWAKTGRKLYEASTLDAHPACALLRVIVPAMSRTIGTSVLIVFMLCFSDYSVPHAFGLIVFPTEILGWAGNSLNPWDTVGPSLPGFAVVILGVVCLIALNRRLLDYSDAGSSVMHQRSSTARWFSTLLIVLSVPAPLVALLANLNETDSFSVALQTYGHDILWSVGTAFSAGVFSVIMGVAFCGRSLVARAGAVWVLAIGAGPGALVGLALVIAYGHPAWRFVYDHWPIVVLSYVARFGWIGVGAAALAARRLPRSIREQAELDGVSGFAGWWWITCPAAAPTLLGGVGIVAGLSLGDVAASALVRVPSFTPVAHVIIEKFHRLEDDMLIALSVLLTGMCIVVVLAGGIVLRFMRGRLQ